MFILGNTVFSLGRVVLIVLIFGVACWRLAPFLILVRDTPTPHQAFRHPQQHTVFVVLATITSILALPVLALTGGLDALIFNVGPAETHILQPASPGNCRIIIAPEMIPLGHGHNQQGYLAMPGSRILEPIHNMVYEYDTPTTDLFTTDEWSLTWAGGNGTLKVGPFLDTTATCPQG